jgi:predicted pyridoxine 5'-phosphate oxidase superfamily flavin-nucleotide-binding protein
LIVDALQLDQLRLAVGSPHRAAVERDDCAPVSAIVVKVDHITVLIAQANIREPLSDPWPPP